MPGDTYRCKDSGMAIEEVAGDGWFARWFTRRCEEEGLTQMEIAIRLGVKSVKTIYNWQHGLAVPQGRNLFRVYELFGFPGSTDTRAYLNGSVVVDLRPEAIAHPFAPDLALAA